MPQLVQELSWQSLTRTINKIKAPSTFLTDLLFSARNTNDTELLEIGKVLGDRRMAPFVRKGAQAFALPGTTTGFRSIEAPNIRVKLPLKPDKLLFGRDPGTPVYIDRDEHVSAVQRKIAREVAYMRSQVDNRVEWMCAQALTSKISYVAADDLHAEAFEFDYVRDAAFTVALGAGDRWNEATADIAGDVRAAADAVMEETGVNITDAICGKDAAEAFLNNDKVQAIVERRRPEEGSPLMLFGRPAPNGARWLGTIHGVNWWVYPRKIKDADGTEVTLIDDKKVFFVSQEAGAQFSLEFGAIPDMTAFEGGSLEAEIFTKSWVEEDPSVVQMLAHSRPFPLMGQPEAVYELQVLA